MFWSEFQVRGPEFEPQGRMNKLLISPLCSPNGTNFSIAAPPPRLRHKPLHTRQEAPEAHEVGDRHRDAWHPHRDAPTEIPDEVVSHRSRRAAAPEGGMQVDDLADGLQEGRSVVGVPTSTGSLLIFAPRGRLAPRGRMTLVGVWSAWVQISAQLFGPPPTGVLRLVDVWRLVGVLLPTPWVGRPAEFR